MKKARSIGIHDGTFHADEVTACALLALFDLADIDKVVRTRDPAKLVECEYVCDVGGIYDSSQKLFDHHQASYEGELSSAGMILDYLRTEKVIPEEEFRHLNRSLVLGVDAHDNGRSTQELGVCTFSHVIANFNPVHYDASSEDLDRAFLAALDFAVGHIERMSSRFRYNLSCREVVLKAMEKDKVCLFFDRSLPWLENFFALGGARHSALFVVMPAAEQWKLRGIPPDYERRMQVRLPLPEAWAGLLGEELKAVSGIEGAVFCHKGRFTSVWETREDAICALKHVLQLNQAIYEDTF
ncbi:MAG: hypothetical protein S4CHLAM2_18130 [Chlamydiales bacterium]|nr:hypothetical protein [Chlamydiales bacterium]